MRRALLVAALAIPAIVLAAVTATTGQLLETTNFSATSGVSYINDAQCKGANLQLQWNISALGGSSFGQDDKYRIFASNKAPAAGSTGGTFCAETDDQPNGTFADQIGSTPATLALESLDVSGAAASMAASSSNTACSATNEGTSIYICAHWYDSAGTTKKGFAFGTFQVQVQAPPFPTGLGTQSGDSSLKVSWAANPTTPTRTDHYVAYAFAQGEAPAVGTVPPFAATPVATATTSSTSATIKGLVNNTVYDIVVVAYSVGGNPSGASATAAGQPAPSADFWEVYQADGGTEQGGCTGGPGGALSLLAAAALLAFRRRKP